MEVILGKERRRWSEDEKRALVAETFVEGETVNGVARRRGVSPSMLFIWRKQYRQASAPVPAATSPRPAVKSEAIGAFTPVAIAPPWPCTPSPAAASSGVRAIELEMRRGARIRIFGAVDPKLAVAVMKAMRQR